VHSFNTHVSMLLSTCIKHAVQLQHVILITLSLLRLRLLRLLLLLLLLLFTLHTCTLLLPQRVHAPGHTGGLLCTSDLKHTLEV